MKALFFFGPDKLPFKLLESGMVENTSKCLGEKTSLNINEGDVVWNGKTAIVVALT